MDYQCEIEKSRFFRSNNKSKTWKDLDTHLPEVNEFIPVDTSKISAPNKLFLIVGNFLRFQKQNNDNDFCSLIGNFKRTQHEATSYKQQQRQTEADYKKFNANK